MKESIRYVETKEKIRDKSCDYFYLSKKMNVFICLLRKAICMMKMEKNEHVFS